MYNLIYEFIANELINSSMANPDLALIMTDVSIVLIYVCLVMMLVWVVNIAKGIFNLW